MSRAYRRAGGVVSGRDSIVMLLLGGGGSGGCCLLSVLMVSLLVHPCRLAWRVILVLVGEYVRSCEHLGDSVCQRARLAGSK